MSATTANQTAAEIAADTASEASVPEHQKNDKRMQDLFKNIKKLGEESSLGRDSLPKLAHAVVKAAADGVIDAEFKNKDGEDSATVLYKRYAAAESSKAVHDHSAGGFKANVSKLRQLIAFGAMASIDAVEVMSDAYETREKSMKRAAEEKSSAKFLSAYPFYVDVARAQQKLDRALTTEELEKIALKPEPNEKELDAVLKQIEKLLEGVVTGENRHKVRDESDLVEAAYNAIKERVGQLATLQQTMKLRKAAEKMGLTLA